MKRIFFVLAMVVVTATSCDKVLEAPNNSILSSSDDHGGSSGGGGGTNISASSVPAAVRTAFNSQFPTATGTEWKKLNNGNYKAQFFVNGVKWEVIYTAAGVQVKLERA
jgi:hypothetical protein